jgi:3-deoxy-D-arabino-heptulosonate 7-phosphate (DAHP) synthase class II
MITWNEQGKCFLAPHQREASEQGITHKHRLFSGHESELKCDDAGNVTLHTEDGNVLIVGRLTSQMDMFHDDDVSVEVIPPPAVTPQPMVNLDTLMAMITQLQNDNNELRARLDSKESAHA